MNETLSGSPRGAKVLLVGESGSGKSFATASLADVPGLQVRYLWCEDAFDSIARYFADKGRKLPDNIAWHRIPMVAVDIDEILEITKNVNLLSFQGVSNMSDGNKSKHQGFIKFQSALAQYIDGRTGRSLGKVSSWGPDCVLVVDSLTALTNMAVTNAVGYQPLRGPNIIGLVQNVLEMVLDWMTSLNCHVVLTAHVERELDEIAGGMKIMVSTIGKKLAPKVPRYFSDVIHAKRDGDKFTWATNTNDFALKTRLLPIAGGLEPTFAKLMAKWRELAALGQAAPGPSSTSA